MKMEDATGILKGVMGFEIQPIATIISPFQEKFGIPRQSGLATKTISRVEFDPALVDPTALRGLEDCTHLWLIFVFHEVKAPLRAATVRPPRLGGNARMGVFATRSPFRPNRLGLSLVELVRVYDFGLEVRGSDLLDQTPVVDIKPYLNYADSVLHAKAWASEAPSPIPVTCSDALQERFATNTVLAQLWELIQDNLRWDPRPAYRNENDTKVYRQRFMDHEISFRRRTDDIEVIDIQSLSPDRLIDE